MNGEQRTARAGSLKTGALGFPALVVASVGATGPAYSLAATIGLLVLISGVQSIAAMLVGFVAMLIAAIAGAQLNREIPSAGSIFSWTRRTLGGAMAFITGAAVLFVGIAIMGVFAQIATQQLFSLLGWAEAANDPLIVLAVSILLLALAAVPAYLGIQLSLRVEMGLLIAQILALLFVGVAAFAHQPAAEPVQAAWFGFGDDPELVFQGALVAIFMFAGWEVATFLSEEAKRGEIVAGRAAIISPIVLVVLYLFVTIGLFRAVGPELIAGAPDGNVFGAVGPLLFDGPMSALVTGAVLFSALAAIESCMVVQARTLFAMARSGALPRRLAATHPVRKAPQTATVVSFVTSAVWLAVFGLVSESFLNDSVAALGFIYVLVYGATCLAAIVMFWRRAMSSVGSFLSRFLLPAVGLVVFLYVGYDSFRFYTGDAPGSVLGLQAPLLIFLGVVVVLVAWYLIGRAMRVPYFTRAGLVAADEEPRA